MPNTDNLKDTLTRIDEAILMYKADIRRGELLNSLLTFPAFKELIIDGYFEAEAKKLFDILIDPTGASPYSPEEIQARLGSISHFKGYVGTKDFPGTIKMNAERASELIIREENYRKEVTAAFAEEE